MSELSEYRVVDAADDPGGPGGSNGKNGVHPSSLASRPGVAPRVGEAPSYTTSGTAPGAAALDEIGGRLPTDTWGANMPALRLAPVGVSDGLEGSGPRSASTLPPSPTPAVDGPAGPPPWLRPVRAVAGVALLALAWAATVGVLALARVLLDGLPQSPDLVTSLALYLLVAIGAAWLAVVAIACVAAAAFSLGLALTVRGW
jgi:hypothetical protein